jgi:hypothetical protein
VSNARLAYDNLARAAATVLSVSSEQSGAPRSWLQDEGRGLKWRSKTGWNVVSGRNDRIDFNRGGDFVATVAAGNYATPALLAAAIVTALEAADAVPVWACTYDSGTGKFTISSGHATTLECNSGANKSRSLMADLGWATNVDTNNVLSHLATNASYKSREWVTVDLGSAQAVTCGIVIEHNLGASGTITQQGHTADTAAGWAAPDVSDVLTGDSTIRLAYRASASKRYWRLLIDDVSTNTAGYSEVGVWFVGVYAEPSVNYSVNFTKTPQPLSTVVRAIGGSVRRDERPSFWVYTMSWLEVPEADRSKLAAWVAACPIGSPFFLAFDPTNAATSVVYGLFTAGVPQSMSGNLYWTVPLTVEEQLP